MKARAIFLILIATISLSFKNDKPAYQLFDGEGKKVKFEKMAKKLAEADIVFFGELHNNPIAHWLQLELTQTLHDSMKDKLVLGAEMFETDNQLILDEYLQGIISEKKFEAEARLWPNYDTDYKPLVSFAKDNKLQFVASNIPRRYASVVFKKGFEGLEELSDDAKKYVAPSPIAYDPELPCYKSMMAMGGMGGGHSTQNFPKAQAIKDATMAHSILKYWEDGKLFLHYNGAYHSDNFESIVWYLKQAKPELNIMTITTVQQAEVDKLMDENKGTANYVVCVPENMTTTY